MSIVEIKGGPVTYQYLMKRRTKSELAHEVLDLLKVIERLRAAQPADDSPVDHAKLVAAAEDFVAKVDNGLARSRDSYAKFKDALGRK